MLHRLLTCDFFYFLVQLAVFLTVTVAVAIGQHIECSGAPHGYFVTHPQSCAHYYSCIQGEIAVPDVCPDGYKFNPLDQLCDFAEMVDCITCAIFGIQTIADPKSCTAYYRCEFGVRQTLTCPQGMHFDVNTGACNAIGAANCDRDPLVPDPLPTQPTAAPPITQPTIPPPITQPTLPPPTGGPIPSEPSIAPTFPPPITPPQPGPNCSSGQIFNVHESDCAKYYLCIDNRAILMQCPTGLLWNQIVNSCDMPDRVTCTV